LSGGGATIYAIIETGGKQYKVTPGKRVKVELLAVADGENVELDHVLAIGDGDKLVVGNPTITGARVTATSNGAGLGTKVHGMKYKSKVRYSRRIGHRQAFTELNINSISGAGMESSTETTAKETVTNEEVTENGS
jgi:large subunit ribosomal protein L21